MYNHSAEEGMRTSGVTRQMQAKLKLLIRMMSHHAEECNNNDEI